LNLGRLELIRWWMIGKWDSAISMDSVIVGGVTERKFQWVKYWEPHEILGTMEFGLKK
jgi:hypothetical protein